MSFALYSCVYRSKTRRSVGVSFWEDWQGRRRCLSLEMCIRDSPRTPWTPPEDLDTPTEEPNVLVCLEVDADRFMNLLLDRVCNR